MKVAILFGSYRPNRAGIRAVRYVERLLKDRRHDVTVVDAMALKLPLLEKRYAEFEKGTAPAGLDWVANVLREADFFLFVTGEYNHSVQPGLSNLIDYFLPEFFFRPSGIVSYSAGDIAGMRAAMGLRAMSGEIGTVSIPSILGIPRIEQTLSEDGTRGDGKTPKSVEKFLAEIEWYGNALKAARANGVPY